MTTLNTPRLKLVLRTRRQTLEQLERLSPEQLREVSAQWLERVWNSTDADPWVHGFVATLREDGTFVGQCGFKAPPDASGVVEIASGIAPGFEGRGFATEAAGELVRFALGQAGVTCVRAHTLPTNVASIRVLAKCGFQSVGEFSDPEDGLVMRFECTGPRAAAAASS